MTVATTTNKAIGTGNGLTTAFPFTFGTLPGEAVSGDLVVSLFDLNDIEIPQTEITDYTVVGEGSEDGGAVIFIVPPPVGYTVLIIREVPVTQPTDIKNQGSFYPRTIERMVDRVIMICQQLTEGIGRALTLPPQVQGVSTQLPTPEPNNLIGWDANNTALRNFSASEIGTTLAFSNFVADKFTASAGQVLFTLSADPGALENLDISVDGVTQVPGIDYSYLGTALTFASAMTGGEKVLARYGTALPTGITDSNAILYTPPSTGITGTIKAFLDSLWATGSNAGAALVRFIQSGTGATPRLVQDKLRERLSLKDFGAVGDGIVDDTEKVQLAVNEAQSSNRLLFVPAGTYKLTGSVIATLQSGNLRITGDGHNKSIFVCNFASPAASFVFGIVGSYTANELSVEEIGVDNTNNESDAYRVNDVGHVLISRCSVMRGSRGIYITGGFVANILDNFMQGIGGEAVFLDNKAANATRVSNNDIFGSGLVTSAAAIHVNGGDNPVIDGNDLEGCYGGVLMSAVNCGVISSNYIENGSYTIYFNNASRNVEVFGNWFGASSQPTTIENCSNIVIRNNAFYNCNLNINTPLVTDIEVGTNNKLGTSVLGVSSWKAPSLINSWVNDNTGYSGFLSTVGYRKDSGGRVHIKGSIKGGTSGSTAFVLPAGYRPLRNLVFACSAFGGVSPSTQVIVELNGNVIVYTGANTNSSLDGVSFLAEA